MSTSAERSEGTNPKTGMTHRELKEFIRNPLEELVNRKNLRAGEVNFAAGFVDFAAGFCWAAANVENTSTATAIDRLNMSILGNQISALAAMGKRRP